MNKSALTSFLILFVTFSSPAQTEEAFTPSVKNAIATLEYGHLSPTFPDYVISFEEYEDSVYVSYYFYTKDENGYPISCLLQEYYLYQGTSWTLEFEEEWVYTWEQENIQRVQYGSAAEMIALWLTNSLVSAEVIVDNVVSEKITYHFDDSLLAHYGSTYLDEEGNWLVYTTDLTYDGERLTSIRTWDDTGYEEVDSLTYDQEGYLVKAEGTFVRHRYSYEPLAPETDLKRLAMEQWLADFSPEQEL